MKKKRILWRGPEYRVWAELDGVYLYIRPTGGTTYSLDRASEISSDRIGVYATLAAAKRAGSKWLRSGRAL